MRRMAKMKSATRMALVTGEMSDCMSGAEPGRAAWSSASVRPQSAISLALLLSSPPLRWQLLRMELGALLCASTHIYKLTRMHTHSNSPYTGDPGAQRVGASLARSGTVVGCLSPDPHSLAACRTSEETETGESGVITTALPSKKTAVAYKKTKNT